MRFWLNKSIILIILLLIMLNFYLPAKSIVAYNTENLTTTSIIAKNEMVNKTNTN